MAAGQCKPRNKRVVEGGDIRDHPVLEPSRGEELQDALRVSGGKEGAKRAERAGGHAVGEERVVEVNAAPVLRVRLSELGR